MKFAKIPDEWRIPLNTEYLGLALIIFSKFSFHKGNPGIQLMDPPGYAPEWDLLFVYWTPTSSLFIDMVFLKLHVFRGCQSVTIHVPKFVDSQIICSLDQICDEPVWCIQHFLSHPAVSSFASIHCTRQPFEMMPYSCFCQPMVVWAVLLASVYS